MPRAIDKDLRDCLERANPYTEYRIEISQPDVSQVLRRTDQFTQAPSLVSMTPAASLAASARGALILAPSVGALQTFAGTAGSYDLNGENSQRRVKGMAWTMDKSFSRCTLKSVQAKVQRVAFAGFFFDADIECQVFRITKTPGVKQKNVGTPQYQSVAWTDYTFTPLLSPAPTLKASAQVWDGTQTATLNFDLTNWNLTLENSPAKAVAPDQVGELPEYLIVVRLTGKPPAGTGHYRWLVDTASARTIAGIGTFERVWWNRNTDQDQWIRTAFADVPNIVLNVETYPGTGQGVYLIDQGKAPSAASTGRVDFQRSLPPGTTATAEISTAGSGGPYTTVRHGDRLNGINYVTQPEQFDQAAWIKSAVGAGVVPVVTPDLGIAPDGSLTADKIVFSSPAGATDQSIIRQDGLYAITAGSPYTGSWYVKAFAAGDVGKQIVMRNVGRAAYTLITLTADWQRVQASEVAFNALSYIEFGMRPNGSGVGGSTGAVSVYLWHAQLEPGLVATAPTLMLPVQQTYHLRVTLGADAALKATPQVSSLGVEYRIPQDVSVEGIPDLPTREIALPWPKASIPEGRVRVVRTGVRDYLDVASVIGSTAPTPRLEADIFLASRHPSVTREKWLRLERMLVTNRVPSATSEEFTLLSYASRLKRKIPQKVETINSVHTVQGGSTAAQVIVSPGLPGTTVSGNEYDGKGYYMRVRSTTAPNTPPGFPATIQGNTSTDRLDFSPALIEALVAGDVIEVHSGIFQTAPVSWVDADPADVWDGLLALVPIPPERIGAGNLPRGGKPPRVTDIAPGDAATQAKLKITVRLSEEESADELIDQISTILGGVTLEIDGQMVYVQIMPLTDVAGNITVPLPPPAAVFDSRDIASLGTPPGLEKRTTIVSCSYGVPATAAAPDAFPSKSTTSVDQDALLWLAQQDIEDYGTADVDDKITRWLYNTSDAGLYLASVICTRMVKVGSTGIRIFPMGMTEKHPDLIPGDVVIIGTDQYTDYDPSSQTPIVGPIAVRGVIVRSGREGRDLGIFVPGLIDNVQLVKGGASGILTGLGVIPQPPVLTASFDTSGQLIINSSGDFATASQKLAWATGAAPSAATVRAAAPNNNQLIAGLATGSFYPAGTTVFISAFAYNANGVESTPIATVSVTRQGSGTSAPPVASITPLNGESDDLIWNERFSAVAGSGGGGTNLTWTIYQKIGFAAETTLFSGNATTLPKDAAITRHPRSDKDIRFEIVDVATGLKSVAHLAVPSSRPELNDTGNPYRARAYDDGDYGTRSTTNDGLTAHTNVKEATGKRIARQLAKTLDSDPDNADSVLGGLIRRIPLTGATDSSGNVDMGGAAWINKHAGNLPTRSPSQGGTWSSSGVSLAATAALINDGNLTSNAWHTDSAVPGAFVQVDMGVGTTFDQCRIFGSTAANNSLYKIRGSNDGSSWTDIISNFNPGAAGWNAISFTRATWRYWRAELTNTPGPGSWLNEMEFADESGNANVSHVRGLGAGRVVEDLVPTKVRAFAGLEADGNIQAGIGQKTAGTIKSMAVGRDDSPALAHGASRSFPSNFQNPPSINLVGGVTYEPGAFWGTAAAVDAGTAASAAPAGRQIEERYPISDTVSGYTVRARLRSPGSTTARSNAFPAGAITTPGNDKQVTVASAPAFDDTYYADFTYDFESLGVAGRASSVSATVSLQYWNGSSWITLATFTDGDSDPGTGAGGTGSCGISGSGSLSGTVSGLTGTSLMRILLTANAGTGSRTYSVDPGNLTYTTATGESYASMTPTGVSVNGASIGAS